MGYTYPVLREAVVAVVKKRRKGGRPNEWNARKAQMAAAEYEQLVGILYPKANPYTGKKTKAQQSLSKWTAEEWTTRTGKPAIKNDTTSRYLPKAAWEILTEGEAKATDRKKRKKSKRKQFVANTKKARDAGKKARKKKHSK